MSVNVFPSDNDREMLDFDADNPSLSLKQLPVRYQGKDYVLVEALGDAVAQWRNAQLRGTTMQQQGDSDTRTIALGALADNETLLVSLCLFYPDQGGGLILDNRGDVDTRKRVPQTIVKNWPNRVVARLFEKAKEISGIDQVETVASLEAKIVDLQRRLVKLKQSQEPSEEEALAKN